MPLTHLEFDQIMTALKNLSSPIESTKGGRSVWIPVVECVLLRHTEGYEAPNPHPNQSEKKAGPGAQRRL
jgi:hypothetical protein